MGQPFLVFIVQFHRSFKWKLKFVQGILNNEKSLWREKQRVWRKKEYKHAGAKARLDGSKAALEITEGLIFSEKSFQERTTSTINKQNIHTTCTITLISCYVYILCTEYIHFHLYHYICMYFCFAYYILFKICLQ